MPRNVHPTPFIIRPSDEFSKNIDLRNLSRQLATKYADGHVVTDDDLQIMGRMLWNALGLQETFDAEVESAGDTILSVIIESDRPDVQAYPWETLYHPIHKFIGRNPAFTLTRRIAEGKSAQTNLDKGPLRVLLFTSLPDNVDAERGRLNVEEEQAQVQEALLPWIASGVVQLEMPDDGRFSTLKELLGRFDPHVLFLSGHGKFHHEPHADEAYGTFWFESETGDGESIRDEDIARAVTKTRLQAVILSACESGKAASDYLSNGLMQRISAAGIPHVIGMRESIYDIAGIQFARTLCDALAGQERMDVALQSARAAIQQAMDERGQWCLPMALSPNPQAGLIDWDFQPQAVEAQRLNQRVNTVSLPARFVGRRAEMRRYKIKLTQGALRSLLITGAGGMGKTSLAGKLALDVQKARGDGLFAWSANSEKSWRDFELEMGQTLDKQRVERYDKFLPKAENEVERAKFMLNLFVEQFNGRVILFFDNLETLQDADSLAVKDTTVAAWMQAARVTDGVTVFATSRWQIPDWDGEHLMLARAYYGDFLQIAAMKNLPIKREQIRRVYDALGGNIRGLEFFAAAAKSMDDENVENVFLQTLEQTKTELQANMAIAEIFKRLSDDAKKLLTRLPAYHEAVPIKGLLKLGQDFPDTETLLERLMTVSLLEASDNMQWNVTEYQCAPMVTDWMNENGLIDECSEWLNAVADYHLYLHKNERKNLTQAITTHHALRRAERHDEADRLTLDYIERPLKTAGFYTSLLNDWLLPVCNSGDLVVKAKALNIMGLLHQNIGDYDKSLSYLKQSLATIQQIDHKEGEGSTLNNIGETYRLQGDYELALTCFKQSLVLRQQIGDKTGEGRTLNNIGSVYYAQGDLESALINFRQSLALSQGLSDKAKDGEVLNNIGLIYCGLGDYKLAMSYYKKSLAIRQQIGHKAGEGTTLNNIGDIYRLQGEFESALIYFKQSLSIYQQIGELQGQGTLLNNISQIYEAQGDYETALSYLKQSLAISQQIGDKASEGKAFGNIATIYVAYGDYLTALSYLKHSQEISQQIGDKAGEGTALNNIGEIYRLQGNYETAMIYFKQSLAISLQISDIAGEGKAFGNIANIYMAYGDYERSISYMNKALVIFQKIGNKVDEGVAMGIIGETHRLRGAYKTALDYLKQSLVMCQQIGSLQGQGITLNSIALIYLALGEYGQAVSCFQEALIISQQIGNKIGEGILLNNIGTVYRKSGDYKSAFLYYKRSLVIQKETMDKALFCQILFNIGHIHIQNNQRQKAASAWVIAYVIAKRINMTQVLQELSKLACQFDMPEGLEGWEQLAQDKIR